MFVNISSCPKPRLTQSTLTLSCREDCQAGTCFSGACNGFPFEYSLDGRCGTQNSNLLCANKWGECCNAAGTWYATDMKNYFAKPLANQPSGTGDAFCGMGNCQSGKCTIVIPGPPIASSTTTGAPIPTIIPGTISPDGSCGGANKYKCAGSTFGDCCSGSGFCGSTTAHCSAGCQFLFGTCIASDLSPDGTCGVTHKYKCKESSFGDCCSSSGFCGSSTAHCGSGCQLTYGTCTASDLSPDGSCGKTNKYKCKGSSFGDCCSSSGFCGSSTAHCGSGCQLTYGTCVAITSTASPPKPTNISIDGTCGGTKGLNCKGSGLGECCSSGGFCGSSVQHCAQGWYVLCNALFLVECSNSP